MPPYILLCFPFSLRIFATMRLIPLGYLKTTQRGESSMCAYHRPPTRWLPMLYPRPAHPRRGRDRDMARSETETQALRDWDETETWISVTETRPRPYFCVCVFFTCWICFDHFGVFIQWTLVITNSLGPVKLLCYIKKNYIRVAKQ